jgi:hypothetical protein
VSVALSATGPVDPKATDAGFGTARESVVATFPITLNAAPAVPTSTLPHALPVPPEPVAMAVKMTVPPGVVSDVFTVRNEDTD